MKLVKKSNALTEENTDSAVLFDQARDSVANLHASLLSRIESRNQRVMKDPGLRQDDRIGDAYSELLDSVAKLHSQFDTLSEMLGEHGAVVDKPTKLH